MLEFCISRTQTWEINYQLNFKCDLFLHFYVDILNSNYGMSTKWTKNVAETAKTYVKNSYFRIPNMFVDYCLAFEVFSLRKVE